MHYNKNDRFSSSNIRTILRVGWFKACSAQGKVLESDLNLDLLQSKKTIIYRTDRK